MRDSESLLIDCLCASVAASVDGIDSLPVGSGSGRYFLLPQPSKELHIGSAGVVGWLNSQSLSLFSLFSPCDLL
jgi:hypothetical protein